MKFTLIVEDSIIGIDNEFRRVNLPNLNSITAIQFDNVAGHIEYSDSPNTPLTSLAGYQSLIQLWMDAAPPPIIAPTLLELKQLKVIEINSIRGAKNSSSFPFAGKLIACDQLSRSDIDAVTGFIALTGSLPPSFPGAWKAVDNSYISIPDINTFKAMYGAMVAEGTVNFTRSEQLKGMVAAATTKIQVEAIVW